jgi:hypothetical protein
MISFIDMIEGRKLERPKYVYKYTSAARAIQILKTSSVYMTPVRDLNDLYEFQPAAACFESADIKVKIFAKRLVGESTVADLPEAVALAKQMDDETLESTYRQFKDGLVPTLAAITEHSGVTCFSARRNDQRLWGTYGDSHRGVCIEFHGQPGHGKASEHLSPVFYTNRKLPLCLSDLMTPELKLDVFLATVLLGVKHTDWQGEDEWRLVLIASTEQSKEDRIAKLDRDFFSRVYLGPSVDSTIEREIYEVAAACSPPIPVFKRRIYASEAKEDLLGFEEVRSIDQLLDWVTVFPADRSDRRTPSA